MSKELYIFSGLGADERVFQGIDFLDYKKTFIQWKSPYENESIEDYARRLIYQIPGEKPTLIGLSFGGIIAIEIAKQIEVEKVIIISSAKTKNEIPLYYRIAGLLKLHKLMPNKLLKSSNFVINRFFGASTEYEKNLLKEILNDTDLEFLNWAIDKIVRMSNVTAIENVYHIHGTKDMILPLCFVTCDSKISNGGHFMTVNKSGALNAILNNLLS